MFRKAQLRIFCNPKSVVFQFIMPYIKCMTHLGQYLVGELTKDEHIKEWILACVCRLSDLLGLEGIYKISLGTESGRRSRPAVIERTPKGMKVYFLTTNGSGRGVDLHLCSYYEQCCPGGWRCFDDKKKSYILRKRSFELVEEWFEKYFTKCGVCFFFKFP